MLFESKLLQIVRIAEITCQPLNTFALSAELKILLLLLSLQIHFCKVPESVNAEDCCHQYLSYIYEIHDRAAPERTAWSWTMTSISLNVHFRSTTKDFFPAECFQEMKSNW